MVNFYGKRHDIPREEQYGYQPTERMTAPNLRPYQSAHYSSQNNYGNMAQYGMNALQSQLPPIDPRYGGGYGGGYGGNYDQGRYSARGGNQAYPY